MIGRILFALLQETRKPCTDDTGPVQIASTIFHGDILSKHIPTCSISRHVLGSKPPLTPPVQQEIKHKDVFFLTVSGTCWLSMSRLHSYQAFVLSTLQGYGASDRAVHRTPQIITIPNFGLSLEPGADSYSHAELPPEFELDIASNVCNQPPGRHSPC